MQKYLALLSLLLLTACGLGEMFGSKSSSGNNSQIQSLNLENPIAQIEVHAMESTVSEGENVRFSIGWYGVGPRPESDLTVNLSVTQHEDYTSELLSSIKSITLTENSEFRYVLEIPTIDDGIVEPMGKITVELLPGEGYSISDFEKISPDEATLLEVENLAIRHVNVLDNEPSRIDIHAVEATINEGGNARFRIGWYGVGARPEPGLTVNLYVTQTGRYTNTFPSSITLTEDNGIGGMLEVPTIDDSIAEPNGRITVKLQPGLGYGIYNSRVSWRSKASPIVNWGITYVDVLDNDQPRISISPEYYSVVEGNAARFVIKSDTNAPASDLTVNISTHLVGNFFSQPAPNEFVLKAGRQSDILSIPTEADTDSVKNGGIMVSVKSGSGYVLADLIHTYASVTVIGDNVSTIWAESVTPIIAEGSVAEFEIGTETGPLTEDLTVNISVARYGEDFLDNTDILNLPSINTFLLAKGKVSDILSIPTVVDDVNKRDWKLGLQIQTGDGYQLSGRYFAFIDIIVDNDLPVWIETPKSEIYEGDVASFLVGIGTGDSPLSADRTINLNVSKTGDFVAGQLPATVKLRAGKATEMLELPTVYDDSAVLEGGSITVEILPGVGYAVASISHATVTVLDRETQPVPTLLVAAIRDEIDEGQPAMFRIVADVSRLVSPLTVHFTVQQQGEFLDQVYTEFLPRTFKIEPGRTFLGRAAGTHGFSTEDDINTEDHGAVTLTLQNSAGYKVMQEHGSATVRILDNDGYNTTPRIGISSQLASVVYGLELPFSITSTSDRPLPEGLTVTLNVRQIYSLEEEYEYSRDIVLVKNQQSEDVFLSFVPTNFEVGPDGAKVVVSIAESEEYDVDAGQNKASIRVVPKSQDQLSIIGFTQDVNFVTEGETAKIGVTVINSTAGYIVKMRVTETGEFLNLDLEGDILTVTVPPKLKPSAFMPIPIPENDTYEGDGSATFEILPGIGHHVDEQNSTTVLHIFDNDKPEIFVESESQYVYEGEQAVFAIGAEGDAFAESGKELEIFLRVTDQSDFLLNAPPESFILRSGQSIDYLQLDTVENSQNKGNGFVTVEIDARSGSLYSIKQDYGQASIEIRDNAPDWVVSINKLSDYVYEGDSADFEISRDGTEYESELNVSLRISTVGDFLVNAPPDSFTLRSGRETDILSLETRSDDLIDPDGQVSVEVLPGSGYILHEDTTLQTIEIRDNGRPLPVFVAKLIYFANEGESASFIIGSEDAPAPRDLEILLDVTDPQGFLSKKAPESFSLKKGMYTDNLVLETVDDNIIESNGWISVRILPGVGYQPMAGTSIDRIQIRDNEPKPTIHVRALSQYAFAGEIAEFEIGTTGDAPISDLNISIRVDRQIGQFSVGSNVNWVLSKNKKTDIYRRSSNFGQISVMIMSGAGYTVSDAESAATVTFVSIPTMTVSADGSSSVEEGNSLSFEIRRSGVSPLDTAVNVKVSSVGDFLEDSPPESVTVLSSEDMALLTLDTNDDNINEGDGHVELEILDGTGYLIGTEYTARITVTDNDSKPELSIEALRAEVGKGDTVRFRISATTGSVFELPIYYVLNNPDNLAVGPTVTSILLGVGKETIEFDIPTNENANGQGTFTVGLAQTAKYDIHDLLHTAVVHVYDWPLIGVEPAQAMPLREGGQATFKLISRENRPVQLNVSYTVSQTEVSGTSTLTESFSAGQDSQTFQVATGDNKIYTHDSRISVGLQPGYGYRVSDQYHSSASVPISDNDKPTVSIASKLSGSIKEGDTAVFAVSATGTSATDLQINLRIDDSGGNFLLQPRSTATLPAGRTSAHFSVQTYADTMSENDGRVSVEVVEGLGYDVALPQSNIAGIDVTNVARPLLYLVRERHSVRRGEDAVFTVNAVTTTDNGSIRSISFANNLTISVNRIRSGDLNTVSDSVHWTLPAGQASMTRRIPTGIWNSIAISLIADSEGAYGLYTRYETAATITVINSTDDDGSDAPVSISISSSDPVVEGTGTNPVFRLTADRPATSDQTVNLEVTGALNFVENGNIPQSVVLRAGSETATLEIPIHDDNVDDADGEIMVEILTPANAGDYEIGTPASAKVGVKDDETPPTVSIAGSANVTEGPGAKAVFTVTASKAASDDRKINISISGASDFLASSDIPKFVVLSRNETTATIELEIVDDDIDESSDVLTVTILPPASVDDYWVGDANSTTTTIEDNDSDLLVTIASAGDVVEGTNANLVFTVTARRTESFERTIGLMLVEGSPRFIDNDNVPSQVNLPRDSTSVNVNIPLDNDDVDEADGRFRIKIKPSPSGAYEVLSANVAQATISDDDLPPSVSIVSPEDRTEGTDANVRIAFQATGRASDARVVNLSITGAVSFFQPGSIPSSVTLPPLSTTTRILIPIHDDDVEDLDGTLSIGILPPSASGDYRIGATSTASLNLTNPDDTNPLISISDAVSVVEGTDSNVSFTLTSSKVVGYLRRIELSVTGATNFIDTANQSSYADLPANSSSAAFDLPIHDDNVDEDAGSVSVRILPHSDTNPERVYTVGSPGVGVVQISDNDEPPVLTVAGANVVAHGGGNQAIFTVTATRMAESDKTVRLSVTDSAGVVDLVSLPESVILSRRTLRTDIALPIDESSVSPDDSVSVQILSPAVAGRYSVGSPSTASVNVYLEAAVPQITISDAPAATEGTDTHAVFPIAVTFALSAETTINVIVTGATNFIGPGSLPTTTTIPEGRLNATLEIPIHDDNVDEANGTIHVRIPAHSASHFTIGEANTASVSVADDDQAPRISILTPSPVSLGNGSYIEGTHSKAVIAFESEGLASTNRQINIGVSKQTASSGDFFSAANFTTTATLNALSDSTMLELNILDDNVEENSGVYSVNILPPTNAGDYRLGVKQYYIQLQDNDSNPEMSISGGADVVEGTDSHAVFTIKSSKLTNASRQINLSVSGDIRFITQGLTPAYVLFPSGATETTLQIPIRDDSAHEADGEINVEITEHTTGNSYQVGTPSSASVNVRNDDSPPLISISGPESFVEGNGSHIEFTLSATTLVTSNLTVQLSVSVEAESFIAPSERANFVESDDSNTLTTSAVFEANKMHSTFQLPIHDDEVEESSSRITVTVSPAGTEGGYGVGTPGMASVHLLDDESTSDWPVISIASSTPTAIEGTDQSIDFTLISSKPVSSPIEVLISVTGATEFLHRIPSSVRFANDSTSKEFSIPIKDDTVFDDPGSITVTVLGPFVPDPSIRINREYLISNQKSVDVAIADNESAPVITVLYASPANVGPNASIFLLFRSDKRSSSPRTVNLSVTGALNFLVADTIPDSFEFPANRTTFTLEIPVKDGDVKESSGMVTVTVLDATNSEYLVGSLKKVSAEVRNGVRIPRLFHSQISQRSINDGDPIVEESMPTLFDEQPAELPVVSISAKLPVIQEGSMAEFQITVSQAQPSDLTIILAINVANGTDVTASQDSVVLISGEETVNYAVRTHDDQIAGEDNTVSVEISRGDGYETDYTANVATVRVSDEIDRTRRDGIVLANSVVLPALLERIGSGPVSTAFRRVEQNFAGNTQTMKIAGQDSLKGMILKGGILANESDVFWDSLLDGTSFNIPISSQYGNAGSYSVWGAGERHNVSQHQESFRWNGDLMTGQIGIDAQINEEYLTGLSVSRSAAEAKFGNSIGSVLEYDTESTGIYPYLGWESNDMNSQLQVAAGYSEGGIVVNQDGFEPYYMDSSLFSAGIGGIATMYAIEGGPLRPTSEFNLEGEAWFAKQNLDDQYGYLKDRRLETGYSRMAIESANQFNTDAGASFQPSASLGVLGRIGNGFGIELGSSMTYVNPTGLDVTVDGKSILATDGRARDLKLSGKVGFDLERDGLGLMLSVSPTWNHNSENGQDSIWTSEVSEFGTTTIQFGSSSQFNANIGYGFDLWNRAGVLTPFGEVRLTESVRNEFALGSSFESDSSLEFELEWSGTNSFESGTSQAVKAMSSLKW